MIPHSQPFIPEGVVPVLTEIIRGGQLQSASYRDEVFGRFSEKFNLDNFFFTQSGTHSLYWILKGLELKPDDEVILPTYVCGTIYQAILTAGAKPVLCDVETYWHMSPRTVREKLTPKTKAIIIVNLFGMSLDCAPFREFGAVLINDVCQSYDNFRQKAIDRGDFAMFSFHPTKFITAGNGGAFSILNKKIPFVNYLENESIGYSVSNVNLAILDQQVKGYDAFLQKRRAIADIYFNAIDPALTRHITRENNVFYRFPLIQSAQFFDGIRTDFEKQGVAVRRGVDALIHRAVGESDAAFPNAIKSFEQTVSIPIYPGLSLDDARYIAGIFKVRSAA